MMNTAQVVESVADNSSPQDYFNPDDHSTHDILCL